MSIIKRGSFSKDNKKDRKTSFFKKSSILKSTEVLYIKQEKKVEPKVEEKKSSLENIKKQTLTDNNNKVSDKNNNSNLKAEDIKKDKEISQSEINRLYRKAERELVKAKREAENIIKKAEVEREKILNEASQKKDEIITQANEKKGEILKQAEKELEELKNKAKEDGYKEGILQAKKEFEQEKKEYGKKIFETINSIVDIKRKVIKSLEAEVVKLSIAIAEKIIHTEVKEKEGIVLNMVKAHLEKLQASNKITIRVCREDAPILKENIAFISSSLEGMKNIEIQPDSRVEKGGVIIETDFGTIDSNISTQLETLKAAFSEVVNLDDK